ncbi:MAG: ABC transporter permease, partial [Candidatus Acidiferrales bacterium]
MIRKLWDTLRGRRLYQDIAEELQFHLDQRVDELVAAGKTPEEARRQVHLRFGNKLRIEERTASADTLEWLEGVLRDFTYGLRSLSRTPALSWVAMLSLALAIGANLGIFRVFDALLLRTLPVDEPRTLLQVLPYDSRLPGKATEFWSYPAFRSMRDQSRDTVELFAASGSLRTWVRWGETDATEERAERQYVSGGYFTILRIDAVIGRPLAATGDVAFGAHPVAVLSHGYWQRRFGAAADVLGRKFQMDGHQFEVIGVTREEFFGVEVGKAPDIWLPTAMQDRRLATSWTSGWLKIYGRRRPGVSMERASAALQVVHGRIAEEGARGRRPDMAAPSSAKAVQPRISLVVADKGSSSLRAQYQLPMRIVMSVVALVLLIACANVANLLLARANSRQGELAVRMGIGAGRGRLVRQLLIESLTLAAAASALGLVLAAWATPLLLRLLQTETDSVVVNLSLDWRQLGAAALLCAVTTLLFGLWPAVRASRIHIDQVLKGSRAAGPAIRGILTGRAMVSGQVALSLALLLTAALFLTTLRNLATVHTGFDQSNILIAQLSDPGPSKQEQSRALWN